MKTTKTAITRKSRQTHEFELVGKILVNLGYTKRWFNAYTCEDPMMQGKIYRITNGVAYCEYNPAMPTPEPEVKYANPVNESED